VAVLDVRAIHQDCQRDDRRRGKKQEKRGKDPTEIDAEFQPFVYDELHEQHGLQIQIKKSIFSDGFFFLLKY